MRCAPPPVPIEDLKCTKREPTHSRELYGEIWAQKKAQCQYKFSHGENIRFKASSGVAERVLFITLRLFHANELSTTTTSCSETVKRPSCILAVLLPYLLFECIAFFFFLVTSEMFISYHPNFLPRWNNHFNPTYRFFTFLNLSLTTTTFSKRRAQYKQSSRWSHKDLCTDIFFVLFVPKHWRWNCAGSLLVFL